MYILYIASQVMCQRLRKLRSRTRIAGGGEPSPDWARLNGHWQRLKKRKRKNISLGEEKTSVRKLKAAPTQGKKKMLANREINSNFMESHGSKANAAPRSRGRPALVSHDSLPATNGPPAGASQQDSNLVTEPALHHSGIQPFDHSNCPAQAVDKGPSLRRAPTLRLPDQGEIANPSSFTQAPQSCCEPACAEHRPSRQLQPPVVWRPNGYPPKHSRQRCLMPMEVGCGAARRQASEGTRPVADRTKTSAGRRWPFREPGGFKHWADLSPLAIVKHQTAKTVVEGHNGRRQPCSSEHGGLCNQKVYRRSGKAHRHTHIDSQATSEDGKEIGSG